MFRWLGALTCALLAVLVILAPSACASTGILATPRLTGGVLPAWDTNGGPALTTPAVTSEVTAAHVHTVRYSVLDCAPTETCGTDNHVGTLPDSTLQTAITGITSTLGAVPWLQFPPIAKGSLGGVPDGTVFCPPASGTTGTDWGMNLAMDEHALAAIAQVYTGPIVIEEANEPEWACYQKWGFTSGGASGVSTDIGNLYAATIPALQAYAQSLGFSQVVTDGYIGVNGGTGWGASCPTSNKAYGYSCNVGLRWIDQFNQALIADGAPAPDVESVHSYCHSSDFASAPGAGNPYSFPDNLCYAFQRDWIQAWRGQMDSLWGTATGSQVVAAIDEWQAGNCTSYTSDCWSGYTATTGNPVGSYIKCWMRMLQGNGQTTGPASTEYWSAMMFLLGGNNAGAGTAYDIVNPEHNWYTNVQNTYAQLP